MYQRHKKLNQKGFTVIELVLAMTFLAFIMVFSATLVIQISNTYFKGLSIKQINQAGRTLTEDLSRSLQGSSTADIDLSRVADGVLCMGRVAYIWNPVYDSSNNYDPSVVNRYKLDSKPISLARVSNDAVNNCTGLIPTNIAASSDNVSLLSGHSRVVSATAQRSPIEPKLVNIKFIIGTFDQSESPHLDSGAFSQVANSVYYDTTSNVFTCRPDRLGNFCAFADFQTTVYVTR